MFAPNRQSCKNLTSFFEDTEYTKKIPSPPAPSAADSSGYIYKPLTHIQGYLSPKHADYFIWKLGVFKEGSKVVLGDNLVLVRITGVVGVGCNFIKFGVETLGSSFMDEIPVKRMIISFSLDVFHLSCSQCFKCFFFPRFLKSMRDFANADRIFDGFDMERQRGLSVDYGKVICDMFGGMYRLGISIFPHFYFSIGLQSIHYANSLIYQLPPLSSDFSFCYPSCFISLFYLVPSQFI